MAVIDVRASILMMVAFRGSFCGRGRTGRDIGGGLAVQWFWVCAAGAGGRGRTRARIGSASGECRLGRDGGRRAVALRARRVRAGGLALADQVVALLADSGRLGRDCWSLRRPARPRRALRRARLAAGSARTRRPPRPPCRRGTACRWRRSRGSRAQRSYGGAHTQHIQCGRSRQGGQRVAWAWPSHVFTPAPPLPRGRAAGEASAAVAYWPGVRSRYRASTRQ